MSLYVLLIGIQGSGKGSQAPLITERFGIPHVSTGDLFRAMKTREDELAKQVQATMAAGQLVSDEVTNQMVKERLEQPDAANGVILDGYPRNLVQATWLDDYLKSRHSKLDIVIEFQLDLFVAFKRAFGRVVDKATGDSFNYFYKADGVGWSFENAPDNVFPPRLKGVHQATGRDLTRRPDDADGFAIIKRFDLYVSETQPILHHFQQRGIVTTINADQSIEAVSADITKAIEAAKASV